MSATEGYTYDDYRTGMPPRAFGTETEFTTSHRLEDNIASTPGGRLANYVDPQYFVATGRFPTYSAVVSTGGEIYQDNVPHGPLEYATPECRTPHEMTLHTRMGEQLVDDVSRRLADGAPSTVYTRAGYIEVRLNDGVVMAEDSMGHHENYTSHNVLSQIPMSERISGMNQSIDAHCFADFLMLRKLIDGIGMVTNAGFSITQKPTAINYRKFGGDSLHRQKRPFYAHSGRMEVRSGEGSKSDWAAEFKTGLTSLVLRLIEHGAYPKHLLLKEPTRSVGLLAKDPLATIPLMEGEPMKAIDILREIVNAAMELNQQFPDVPTHEAEAGMQYYKFYDDLHNISLKEHDVSALSDRIDWAARYEYFVKRGATYDTITSRDLNQLRDDLKWDAIGQRDIARRHFRKFGHTALHVPILGPPRTRAAGRTAIVRELYQQGNLKTVDWETVKSNHDEIYHFTNVFSSKYIYAP